MRDKLFQFSELENWQQSTFKWSLKFQTAQKQVSASQQSYLQNFLVSSIIFFPQNKVYKYYDFKGPYSFTGFACFST